MCISDWSSDVCSSALTQAVLAHAGQDHREDAGAEGGRGGAQRRIDGGTAGVLGRLDRERGHDATAGGPPDLEVRAAGRDPYTAGPDGLAVRGLADVQWGSTVQALGEEPSERGRHVLADQDRNRQVGRQGRDELRQGVGPAGPPAYDDGPDGGCRAVGAPTQGGGG